MGIFSFTIGQLHSATDLFAGETWTPPLYAVLGAELLVLALMGTMLTAFLSTSLARFFAPQPVPNLEYADAAATVESLDTVIDGWEVIRGRMISINKQLDGDRDTFVERCLAELHRQQSALVAKRAQVNAEPLHL